MTGPARNTSTGPLYSGGRIDNELTDFVVDYMSTPNGQNLAELVFPRVSVRKDSGKYKVFPRGAFLRPEMRPKPYGDRPVQASYSMTEANYNAKRYALEKVVDWEDYENADARDRVEQSAVRYLAGQRNLTVNLQWADSFMRASKWTHSLKGVTGTPSAGQFLRFDQSGARIVQPLRSVGLWLTRATGLPVNTAVLGAEAFEVMINSPEIVDRVKYTSLGQGTEEVLSQLLGYPRILVAQGGSYNAAQEGQKDDMRFILPSTGILLCHTNPNPNPVDGEPSAGYTFAWDKFGGAGSEQNAMTIRRGEDDRAGADWFQGHTAFDMKVVAPDLGIYLEDVVTSFLGTTPDMIGV